MDPVALLRATYLGAAAAVLAVFALPPLRSRFLDYGARAAKQQPEMNDKGKAGENEILSKLLNYAASCTVPHSWFASFYAVSVTCSLYWLPELVLHGPAFRAVATWLPTQTSAMSFRQVLIVWTFMFTQGSRRLYESLAVGKPSQSRMWFGHWALGILFYTCTSIAVWIEGIPSIQAHEFGAGDLVITGPNLITFVGILLFILASGFQNDCHEYLAGLKTSTKGEKKLAPDEDAQKDKKAPSKSSPEKDEQASLDSQYRLPDHPAWNLCLTPHYFAECLIYLALAIIAAPSGALLNRTFICALVFVGVNLGVTAHATKKWYEQEFGKEAVNGRARMIPFVY